MIPVSAVAERNTNIATGHNKKKSHPAVAFRISERCLLVCRCLGDTEDALDGELIDSPVVEHDAVETALLIGVPYVDDLDGFGLFLEMHKNFHVASWG